MSHENGDPGPELWREDEQPVPLLTADRADSLAEEASPNGDHGLGQPVAAEQPARRSAGDFSAERMLRAPAEAPASGWRRAVFNVTGGLVRLGPSAAELRRRDLVARVKTPAADPAARGARGGSRIGVKKCRRTGWSSTSSTPPS